MKSVPYRIVVGAFLTFPLVVHAADYHTAPDKWIEPRVFHRTVGPEYTHRVTVGRNLRPVREGKHQFSPNKAYYYVAEAADTTKPGPWHSIISVFNERPGHLQVLLTDHSQYNLSLEWINEKLLFLRVWWGRVLGTDVIFDVEKEAVVYQEMIHDGTIPFQQFQQIKNQ